MKYVSAKRLVAVGAAGLVLAGASTVAAQISYRTVVLSGDEAPGTGGAEFSFLNPPVISGEGDVTFFGVLRVGIAGVDESNDEGIWTTSGGGSALHLVTREGDVAPGTGGARFDRLAVIAFAPTMSASGAVVFSARLASGTAGVDETNDEGMWIRAPGPLGLLELVAREGDEPMGAGGPRLGALFDAPLWVSGTGEVLFWTSVTGAGGLDDASLWRRRSGGALELVAREGDEAPGGGGAEFYNFDYPVLNPSGQIGFAANVRDGNGSPSSNVRGLWVSGPAGMLEVRLLEGDVAPETGGARFGGFGAAVLNGGGDMALTAGLRMGEHGVDETNNVGVWVGAAAAGGTLELVARRGFDAPGTGGADFGSTFRPVVNASGEIAFTADLQAGVDGVDETNDWGLWSSGGGGQLRLIAREGDPKPGRPGASFGEFAPFGGFSVPYRDVPGMNTAGDVVFPDGQEVWAYSSALDRLLQIAPYFEQVDVNNDPAVEDLRRFSDRFVVVGSGLEDGRATGLNEVGEIAVRASFWSGDPYGILIATLPSCLCEQDGMAGVDVFDLLAYLDLWFALDAAADVDEIGGVDVFDLLVFLDCWFGGCE